MNLQHLIWMPAGGVVSFLASFVFGDLSVIPVDLYYLIYFVAVIGFLVLYAKATGLALREWTSNPVASPIAHVFMHVAAVLHSHNTDLFLPPHRGNRSPGAQ